MCLLTESMPLKYANELSEKMFNWVFYFREEEEEEESGWKPGEHRYVRKFDTYQTYKTYKT